MTDEQKLALKLAIEVLDEKMQETGDQKYALASNQLVDLKQELENEIE